VRALGLSESYLGFTMVAITNEFWREQVSAIDFKRRLLLLPHCLKNAGLPGRLRRVWPRLQKVRGLATSADFKVKAEELGLQRYWCPKARPIVLRSSSSGHVDAIGGVACLNVLEKALDKILLAACHAWPRRYCPATAAARSVDAIGFPN